MPTIFQETFHDQLVNSCTLDIKATRKVVQTRAVEAAKARKPNRVLGAATPDVNDLVEREISR